MQFTSLREKGGSSKTGVLGPKTADNFKQIELLTLRRQLESLSTPIKEAARFTFLLNQDLKRRDLQEFQCILLGKIQRTLQKQLEAQGFDIRKFKIGGHERGTYEKFFRVEPRQCMSKAQFITAMRRCFGEGLLKSENEASKLFDSFDLDRRDSMDWRVFLFLLTILMQPLIPYQEHLLYGFALYSSSGTLDLDCNDRISLAAIKELLCSPVLLTLRPEIRHNIDQAWIDLVDRDLAAAQAAATLKAAIDVDQAMLSYDLFLQLLNYPTLARYCEPSTPYGKRDARVWLTHMEEHFYHELLRSPLKILRRELRNKNECDSFIGLVKVRIKAKVIENFKVLRDRRIKARKLIISSEVRRRNGDRSVCFDRWRRATLQQAAINHIQRIVRGFAARRRKRFLVSMQARASSVQRNVRKMHAVQVYRALAMKQRWGAVTIQRHIRAYLARKRVRSIVEARFDTGRRVIQKKREEWMKGRQIRFAVALQRMARRFLKRRARMRKMELETKIELAKMDMNEILEKNRVENAVYQNKLIDWYQERKVAYERDRYLESHTAEEKAKINSYRNKNNEIDFQQKKREREIYLERMEELRIEAWLQKWDEKRDQRMKAKAALCRRALQLPETPDEVELKKELQIRIKKHLKHVLRRADKQKIPMEIPEAMAVATAEIIEMEVQLEKKRADEERFNEATEAQRKEEEKAALAKSNEERLRKRKRKWAAVVLQKNYRAFCARKILRAKAYERYKKMFDRNSLNYYYVDGRSRKTFWKKPKSLGSYDIDADEGWIVVADANALSDPNAIGVRSEFYFYEPRTWKMQWTQPPGTLMCDFCAKDFVIARLSKDAKCYCEGCMNKEAQALMETMHPSLILFRPFPGNLETSAKIRITSIKETTWYKHMISMDPSLKQALAGEEAVLQEQLAKEKAAKALLCSRCNDANAEVQCDLCVAPFCTTCFAHKHKKAPWDAHTFQEIKAATAPGPPPIRNGAKMTNGKSNKTKPPGPP